MREVQASDAKAHLPPLLEDVERGETVVITRHGRPSDEARVPSLWWFEVRNTLIVNERCGRLTDGDTAAFLRGLSRLGITVDRSPDEAAVLTLARRHRLPVYDASYLELAQRAPNRCLFSILAVHHDEKLSGGMGQPGGRGEKHGAGQSAA